MARLFIFVPEDLHDQLRYKAIETKRTHSELTTEALEKYLGFESKMKGQPQEGEDKDTEIDKTE